MQKITSAYANKMLRSLEEDKAFWVNKEASSSTYVAAVNEEPVIPEYDYMTVAHTIDEIDRKIITIKHALNLTNATAKVQVGEQEMSIDSILVRMAQLNKRKAVLDANNVVRDCQKRPYGSAFSSDLVQRLSISISTTIRTGYLLWGYPAVIMNMTRRDHGPIRSWTCRSHRIAITRRRTSVQ